MKVCMLAYTFYESDNRVRRYAETLARRGDSVDAIVLRQAGEPDKGIVEGVRVLRVQGRVRNEKSGFDHLLRLLIFLLRSMAVLTREHLKQRYDVIHVHSVPDFLVFAALFARIAGAKVILDIHDVVPELYATKFKASQDSLVFRMLLWEEKLSAAFSNRVIVANHIWLNRVAARTGYGNKCVAILNYPDPAIFYQRPAGEPNREFTICYPGTLSRHQGVDLIISAMALLRDTAPPIRFLVIGSGHQEQELRDQAKQCGLADRVIFKGRLPLEKVAETMASVDLGVEPKRNEPFAGDAMSTKIAEFMAMDVPVLASVTRVHKYYFPDDMVEYFESDNAADLAAGMLRLMNDPAKRDALRERGRDFIRENTWAVRKSEYLNLIEAMLAGRQAPAAGLARDKGL